MRQWWKAVIQALMQSFSKKKSKFKKIETKLMKVLIPWSFIGSWSLGRDIPVITSFVGWKFKAPMIKICALNF